MENIHILLLRFMIQNAEWKIVFYSICQDEVLRIEGACRCQKILFTYLENREIYKSYKMYHVVEILYENSIHCPRWTSHTTVLDTVKYIIVITFTKHIKST